MRLCLKQGSGPLTRNIGIPIQTTSLEITCAFCLYIMGPTDLIDVHVFFGTRFHIRYAKLFSQFLSRCRVHSSPICAVTLVPDQYLLHFSGCML